MWFVVVWFGRCCVLFVVWCLFIDDVFGLFVSLFVVCWCS